MSRFASVIRAAALLAMLVVSSVRAQDGRQPFEINQMDSAVVYEVNVRQFTPEGTFEALMPHLPRLRAMGVDVLWLMPLHPIGELNRLGTLGSYYSVRDYKAVNPEFGSARDLQALIAKAHGLGMLVMMDWVANHTSWDHVWTQTHPDRYTLDEQGNFRPPIPQWGDVIELNYDNPETRRAMIDAMRWWVDKFGIDGFRCDYAEGVPASFWSDAIAELRTARPLYMLAEGHHPWLLECDFDALYFWGVGDAILRIVNGEDNAYGLRWQVSTHALPQLEMQPPRARMSFTSNHDWNSWEGTAVSRFGDAWEAATVLTFTLPGIPLVYSGQEAGLDRQLAFFDKDQIDWRPHTAADLYTRLASLRRSNPAVQRAVGPVEFEWLDLTPREQVVAFRRRAGESEVVVIVNLASQSAALAPFDPGRPMVNLDGEPAVVPTELGAWEWVVLSASE